MKQRKALLVGLVFLCCALLSAQENDDTQQKHLKYLTLEQRELLKEQQELLDETKTIFKNSLSKEQLAIFKDPNTSKEQKTKLLKASLSQKQRNIVTNNRNVLRVKRDKFRRSLTKKQRLRLRRFLSNKSPDDRRRLVRRLKILIRENMNRRRGSNNN